MSMSMEESMAAGEALLMFFALVGVGVVSAFFLIAGLALLTYAVIKAVVGGP